VDNPPLHVDTRSRRGKKHERDCLRANRALSRTPSIPRTGAPSLYTYGRTSVN